MQDKKIYSEVSKLLILTSSKASLYSLNHPIVKESLRELFSKLSQLLQENPKATISLKGETLLFNDTPLSERGLGAQELVHKLKGLHIESLSFGMGLKVSELESLISLLKGGKKLTEQEEKLKEKLFSNGLAHIKANVIRYERVKEDEKIVSSAVKEAQSFLKEKQAPPRVSAIEDDLGVLANFLSGKADFKLVEKHKDSIISKLITDPAAVAEIVAQAGKTCGSLRKVWEKFQECIIDEFGSELLRKRRKPERILSSLERNIAKDVDKLFSAYDADIQKQDLHTLICDFSDKLKISLLTKIFQTTNPDNAKFLKRSKSLLSNIESYIKLKEQIRSSLLVEGLEGPDCDTLLSELEASLQPEEKISISRRELEQLKKKSELFDKTLIERVDEATDELKKKNKRLADEKERVDAVIRNLADGLVVVDKQGKVLMMNPAAQQLLGVDKDKKIGRPIQEILSEHQLVALTKGNLADEAGSVSKEIELKSADEQTKRTLRASTAVVENENGNTVGMVMMLSDITRMKQVEKMKTDFVSHVSHELRTPLIATQKSLSLLLSKAAGEINEDQNKFLQIADSNLSRLSRLIVDILDSSKIEAGKLSVNPATFNLVELIDEIIQTLGTWAQEKQIQLVKEAPGEKLQIEADKDRIGQVLTNLVGNALKFTSKQGKIVISCKEIAGGEQVQINVIDNGIGIAKKDCQRIFDKFEQVSLVYPSGIGGTGLGLHICKEIIQLHNGKIWAESEIEKGSTFSFILPKKFGGKDAKYK